MKNREISWTNIYSLQLLPAVVLWVLTPLLEARTTIVASMAVGVVWIVVRSKDQKKNPDKYKQ